MRKVVIFIFTMLGVFLIDQGVKDIFEMGYEWHSKCISLELHLNKGVAFSMLEFLGDKLKWLQIILVTILIYFVYMEGWFKKYPFSLGLLAGGALGNLYDRFLNGAVTDYVYWHCGFNFAVFNLADVMIDLGIALILLQEFILYRKKQK